MPILKSQNRLLQPPSTNNEYEVVTHTLLRLLEDAKNHVPSYGAADYAKDCHEITKRVATQGVAFVTSILPNLAKGLFDFLEGRHATYTGFKLYRNRPQFLRGLFAVAMDNTTDEMQRTTAIRFIYQISVSFKKLRGAYKKSGLVRQYEEFCATDAALGKIDFMSEDRKPLLDHARAMCTALFKGFNLDSCDIIPRPGPGATNTPTNHSQRYSPLVVYRQIDNVMSYQEWFYPSAWDPCCQARSFLELHNSGLEYPTSRFKFVPKTYEKARGICIEENEMQWMQQGLRRGITRVIEQSEYNYCVALDKQSINATLALVSSKTQEDATIDMSEASDRVARVLVSYIFFDTEIHDALMALSTRFITPPTECNTYPILETNKFAPMGSGLCFPIMTLIHLFLIKAIVLASSVQNRYELSKRIYVYGDDIVLPSICVQAVFDWLPRFGMKLNQDKSFHRSKFRESCGVHAYNGVDITPVYFKYMFDDHSIGAVISTASVEAQLFGSQLRRTASYARDWLAIANVKNYVHPDSGVLGIMRKGIPSEFRDLRYKKRYNWELQAYTYRVPRVVKRATDCQLIDGISAYMRWFSVNAQDSERVWDSSTNLMVSWEWVEESSLRSD